MVVRAVASVLTAEEQVMNPSLYPRQRRTRPGDVTKSSIIPYILSQGAFFFLGGGGGDKFQLF